MKKPIVVAIVLLLCVSVCFAQKKTPTEELLEKQNDYVLSRPPGYLEEQKKENDRVVSHEEAMKQAWKGHNPSDFMIDKSICREKFLFKDNFSRDVFAGSCEDNHHYYRTEGQPKRWVD